MKTAFPSPALTIIGPELTKYGNDIFGPGNNLMNDLIGGSANSIMGSISGGAANGQYFIDVISFHYYPQNITLRSDVIGNPTNTTDGFKHLLSTTATNKRAIVQMIATNTSRTSANLQIACTEFNLINNNNTYDESNTTGYANMIKDIGFRSFLGGQWMAEVFCEAMANGWVQFMNPWSAQESGAGACTDGLGYISNCTSTPSPFNKRPTYWHYKMIATNFKDTYLANSYNGSPANSVNHKAYAYKNTTSGAHEIGVIVMNQDLQSPRGTDATTNTVAINFNNSNPTTLRNINVRLGITSSIPEYYCTIARETTMLLIFDSNSPYALLRKEVYNLGDALRPIDIGPEVWGTPAANTLSITTQAQFNSYYDAVYSDLTITPASPITEVSTDTKILRYTNNAIVNGDFTVPLGATFTLLPTLSCP